MKRVFLVVFILLPLMIFTYACSQSESIVSSVSDIDIPSVSSVVDKISHVGETLQPSSTVAEKPVDEEVEEVKETKKLIEEATPAKQEALPEVSPAAEVEEVVQISLDQGKSLFNANCAACHAGGVNRVVASKSLKKDPLMEYDMYSQDAIAYQITNGKNAMPAFKGRLQTEQIQNIAAYVLNQADNNWSNS